MKKHTLYYCTLKHSAACKHMVLVIPVIISGEAWFPLTWYVGWVERNTKEKSKQEANMKAIRKKERKLNILGKNKWTYQHNNNLFLPWKLDPNAWKSSAGIHALKTSGEEEQRGLSLPLFRCGVIMMIKSQLQSYSKQWYAHSWGDSQSAGFPGSLFPLLETVRHGVTLSDNGDGQFYL